MLVDVRLRLARQLPKHSFWWQRQRQHFVVRDLTSSGVVLEKPRPWLLQFDDLDAP